MGALEISPKSVVREMVENAMTFTELVSRYDVGRSEGVVLRYLTDAYRALRQIVPESMQTDEVRSIVEWLAALIRAVDSSLLDEWEALSQGRSWDQAGDADASAGAELAFGADEDGTVAFSANRHAFRTAVRAAMFARVELMSRDDVDGLARLDGAGAPGALAGAGPWSADDWDRALERYWAEHDWIGIDAAARSASMCALNEAPAREDVLAVLSPSASSDADRRLAGRAEALADLVDEAPPGSYWLAEQTLADPDGDHDWRIAALVDVAASDRAGAVDLVIVTVAAR